jgi:hypothetical protein
MLALIQLFRSQVFKEMLALIQLFLVHKVFKVFKAMLLIR